MQGSDVAAVDPAELRRGIGYVIQQVGAYPGVSPNSRRTAATPLRSIATWVRSLYPPTRTRSGTSGGQGQLRILYLPAPRCRYLCVMHT